MTKIVNIRYDKYDEYIGRAGKGQSGYFGNSHVIGLCKICNCVHNREECIDAFKKDFDIRIQNDPIYKTRVLGLRNQILGCFCKEKGREVACHGDVYIEFLDASGNTDS